MIRKNHIYNSVQYNESNGKDLINLFKNRCRLERGVSFLVNRMSVFNLA